MTEEESEDRPDAWGELNARYRHDSDAQFLLVADQLVEIRELLLTGDMTKLRIGLVAVDNLGEVLLARHLRRLDEVARQPMRIVLPRLDSQQRRRFRGDFSFRVEIGLQGATAGWMAPFMPPLLDSLDAAIFRTGHEYRNRVYHADHHNPTVLPIIAQLYMAAVCRAWVRQQPTQTAGTMSPRFRRHVDALGYDDAARAEGEFGTGYFAPAAAAEVIGRRLCEGLQPTLDELKAQLSSDLLWRTAWAEEMIEDLAREIGCHERVFDMLRWGDLWDQFGHEPELVRLEREIAELEVSLDQDVSLQRGYQQISKLSQKRHERVKHLLQETRSEFDAAKFGRIASLARRLRTAQNFGSLLDRYEHLDQEAEKIERLLDDAAISWEEHVQQESDRLRGK